MNQSAGLLLLIIIVAVGAVGVWAISNITNHNPALNLTEPIIIRQIHLIIPALQVQAPTTSTVVEVIPEAIVVEVVVEVIPEALK